MPPSNLTDTDRNAEARLVERCRRGEPGAFEELYRQHASRLYGLACRMTGSTSGRRRSPAGGLPAGAPEAREASRAIRRSEPGSTGSRRTAASISCAAGSIASSGQRRRSTRCSPVRAGATAPFRIDRLDLERAILQLPPGYRAAFVLHDVEGFDHAEVAAQLGIAEGTSKSQVHKARLKIRELLAARVEAS